MTTRQFPSRRSPILARHGMVATSQPLAAMAGLRILMDGGNAADAAVTVAAMLNVVEPMSTGIGGDCFALIYEASTRTGNGPQRQRSRPGGLYAGGSAAARTGRDPLHRAACR